MFATDTAVLRYARAPAILAAMLHLSGAHAAGLASPPDRDADGVPDSADNCLIVPNHDQRDTDVDGYGNICDGDFNNDGLTNFGDLAQLKANFLGNSPLHDLTGDGVVNFADLAGFKQMFSGPPGPSGKITACIGSDCDSPAALCEEGTEDPPLVVAWDMLPDPDSLTTAPPGAMLPLTVTSKMATTVFVDVEVAVALDAVRRTISLGTVPLQPFGSTTLLLNPADFNFDFSGLDFSGRLVARATARQTPGAAVERMAYTPHGFLHVAGGNLQFYRENTMLRDFNAGDYDKIASGPRQWASSRGITLVGVGHAGRLVLNEDDGGPRGPRQE